MSTRTLTADGAPWRKIAASGLQVASWFTTLWAVQWIWSDGTLGAQVMLALALEATFVILKEQMYRGRSGVGWVGVAIDAVINCGGILPKAGKILTFPPIALLLSLAGIRLVEPPGGLTVYLTAERAATMSEPIGVYVVGSFLVAAIGGILLSVLPHRLWRD